MSDEIAIKVKNLSKCYQIYDQPRDRLKQMILPRLQRVVGVLSKKYFREFWAIKDVSFEVRKGETVGIIGRNGSGKSTLLQVICGTLNPTSGSIQTNGRIAALLELGSGFNPEFTGRENIYMNASVLGLSNEEIDARFEAIVAFADIGGFLEQPVKTYSSGMVVRLAFAVIAHVNADVLVIDEALAVGDAVFVQKCNRFIRGFRERGTLLFVSHSPQSVLELCDRSIWLKDGVVERDDEAKVVVRNYNAYVHQQINADSTVSVVENRYATQQTNRLLPNSDIRKTLLIDSNRKFEIELHDFDMESSYWGGGGAVITGIELLSTDGVRLNTIEDCGPILVRVQCKAIVFLNRPIVGINIRNQRGVELISENSHIAYYFDAPPRISAGEEFVAIFRFFLPYLPAGEYTLGAAIADGTQEKFIQHHRRDEGIRFSVISSHFVHGLFAMPLEECRITLK